MRRHPCCLPSLALASVTWLAGSIEAQSVIRQRVAITAGDNVRVSKARSAQAHYENLAAGDPTHPRRMISRIHVYPRGGLVGFEQQCYTTFDGGEPCRRSYTYPTSAPTMKISAA